LTAATTVYARFRETALRREEAGFLNVLPETADIYGIAAGEISYRAMLDRVERWRSAFASRGYGESHRVGLLLQNRPVFVELWFALNALGVSVVPINPDLRLSELEYIIAHSEMNAAFERPISAAHSKFGGRVPDGKLNEKVAQQTTRIVQRYVRSMDRADYPALLYEIENYARSINSLFTQFKPHDDRFPEAERKDALFSCFYVLKTLLIMLYPFVPSTMDRLRQSLRLPESVFRIDELGTPIPAGHELGQKLPYFPSAAGSPAAALDSSGEGSVASGAGRAADSGSGDATG